MDHEYDAIVVPAWPNDQRFSRLRNLALTTDIRILTYPFEHKWVLRHQSRESARLREGRLDAERRASITEIDSRILAGVDDLDRHAERPEGQEITLDLPIFRLEERVARRRIEQPVGVASGEDSREARLVRFSGGCYALLTKWAGLPILNDLIGKSRGDNVKLVRAMASQLSAGDFVLFRVGSDTDFVRLIAEESAGVETYRRVRHISERWRSALRHLGSSPVAVQKLLADQGLVKTQATVSAWIDDPDRIGPRDEGDIEIIARAANDADLLSRKDEVIQAISQIRGAHLAAGMRLTKLILGELDGRLDELGDQPALLDLGYGQAWVVQVESVETRPQHYPVNQVNRLLWISESAF